MTDSTPPHTVDDLLGYLGQVAEGLVDVPGWDQLASAVHDYAILAGEDEATPEGCLAAYDPLRKRLDEAAHVARNGLDPNAPDQPYKAGSIAVIGALHKTLGPRPKSRRAVEH